MGMCLMREKGAFTQVSVSVAEDYIFREFFDDFYFLMMNSAFTSLGIAQICCRDLEPHRSTRLRVGFRTATQLGLRRTCQESRRGSTRNWTAPQVHGLPTMELVRIGLQANTRVANSRVRNGPVGKRLIMKNFSGTGFGNKAVGFNSPTQLPRDDAQRRQWQSANRIWWEATPMRYDWRDAIVTPPGSEAYFIEIARRFLASARKYMPWVEVPFDEIIPFKRLRDQDVLEIGVGHGTHAQLLAPRCKSFIGIDLTSQAADRSSSPRPPEATPGGHGARWRSEISRAPTSWGIVPRRPYAEDLIEADCASEGSRTQA